MNPTPFSDSELLSKFEEYLIYLNSGNYTERTILEYNQISEEIIQRKWTIKKREEKIWKD